MLTFALGMKSNLNIESLRQFRDIKEYYYGSKISNCG